MGASPLKFDLDQLTWIELEELEDALGQTVASLITVDDEGNALPPPIKVIAAFTWMIARRGNPSLTFAEFRAGKVDDTSLPKATPTRPTKRAANGARRGRS